MKRILWYLMLSLPLMTNAQSVDPAMFDGLRWRMIGPHRGGRTVGAAMVPGHPNECYIGVNNGGVWKTNDYGRTWIPIFDGQPTGSIGALAVAPSNPKIVYVGTGEGLLRPDLSVGDGMFKSTDAGKTWSHIGLADAQQIGSIVVDAQNPDRLFVAVLGHPYGANKQRGVFRSLDGGKHWDQVHFIDENTGAIALAIDPHNPNVIFADMWAARHGPWENGEWQGTTGGLFRSNDAGNTWRLVEGGLPTGKQGAGRIGFAIAPQDPSRMYATVDDGNLAGIYRSDDGGGHWRIISRDARLWGRGDDFAEIKVDPHNKDIVYVANVGVHKSTDGGTTWSNFKGAPGGDDYHTILINPESSDVILLAADQGAVISVNGGETWSSWYNQPTAQFYHVATDNSFPYNVYGGQQESGSAGVASRGNDGQITFREWHPVGADEWAYVAPDPLDPNIIYGGCVTRYDKTTGQVQNVAPEAIRSGKFRRLRTMPLIFSPVDPHILFSATNVLWKTTNGGIAWNAISPDLSRENPDVPSSIGIYRTKDLATMPRRGVIYAVAPSYKNADVIWAGTDDGLVHVTRDGGKHWTNITPPEVSSWNKIAQIDAGRFDQATAYVAVNCIRLDDQRPYIYRTHDGGKTWKLIVDGLAANGPVNIVREDPVRPGLLFAGTEREVYVSFDDGDHWKSLRRNMPATSIRDLVVKDDDLVIATHGRSFWILDNITPLRQKIESATRADFQLFSPQKAIRVRWNTNTDTPLPPDEPAGENPPEGAGIDYFLRSDAQTVTLEIVDSVSHVVRKYSSDDKEDTLREGSFPYPLSWARPFQSLSRNKGMHRFFWDMHYPAPEGFRPWFPMCAIKANTPAAPLGPWVLPGTYRVRLTVDGSSATEMLKVDMDPRVRTSGAALRRQFEASKACWEALRVLHENIIEGVVLQNALRAQIGASNSARRDSLAALEKRLNVMIGTGDDDEIDASYAQVNRVNDSDLSLKNLSKAFNYLLVVMQNADAEPTGAQHDSLGELRLRAEKFLATYGSAVKQISATLNM